MVPPVPGGAHAKTHGDAPSNLAPVQVRLHGGPVRRLEHLIIVPSGIPVQVQQTVAQAVGPIGLPILRHGHIYPLGQKTHGVGIGQIFNVHNKIDDAAALLTAEAVIVLFVLQNMEGGCFFIVKRTAAPVASALGLQGHIAPHYIQNVVSGGQLVQKALRKCHFPPPFRILAQHCATCFQLFYTNKKSKFLFSCKKIIPPGAAG